jgi:hypothetical protein
MSFRRSFRRAITAFAVLSTIGLAAPLLSASPATAVHCGGIGPACTAPTTQIDTSTGTPHEIDPISQDTSNRIATFNFSVAGGDETNIVYQCKLEKLGGPAGTFAPCTSPAVYTGLTDGGYRFSVQATQNPDSLLGIPLGNPVPGTVDTFIWEVIPGEPGGAVGDPVTFVGNKPARWHLADWFSVDLTASEPTSSFVCLLDGQVVPNRGGKNPRTCTNTEFNYFGVGAGDHTLRIRAVDLDGNKDATPVVVKFSIPQSAQFLTKLHGHWIRRTGRGYMEDTYLLATSHGASISHGFSGRRNIILLVSKGPGYGSLDVLIKGKLVKRINLNATTVRHQVLIQIKKYKVPTRGDVKVVVSSHRKSVYIEALGFSSRP